MHDLVMGGRRSKVPEIASAAIISCEWVRGTWYIVVIFEQEKVVRRMSAVIANS